MQLSMGFFLYSIPIFALLLSVVTGRAPGDGDDFCTNTLPNTEIQAPVHPSNVKILMDSFNYLNLLPPHGGAVWMQLDLDDNNVGGEGTEVSMLTLMVNVYLESPLLLHSGVRTAMMFVASQ